MLTKNCQNCGVEFYIESDYETLCTKCRSAKIHDEMIKNNIGLMDAINKDIQSRTKAAQKDLKQLSDDELMSLSSRINDDLIAHQLQGKPLPDPVLSLAVMNEVSKREFSAGWFWNRLRKPGEYKKWVDHQCMINKSSLRLASIIAKKFEGADYKKAIPCFEKAQDLNEEGKTEEAIEWYDKALESDPNYVEAWYEKGSCLELLDKFDEAIECYDKAIAINPNYTFAWSSKADCLSVLGRNEESLEWYDRILKIYPDLPSAWQGKGIALFELGRYNEALYCFDKLLIIESKATQKSPYYNAAQTWKQKILKILDN